MKRNSDFVTNSSSTSYLLINKKEITAEEFVEKLWRNGLEKAIKDNLVKGVKDLFPLRKGLNEISAYSDCDDMFSQLFTYPDIPGIYKGINCEDFWIREGCIEHVEFDDDGEYNYKEYVDTVPEEYRKIIDEHNKK